MAATFAAVASLVLSWWSIQLDGVINRDGVEYIRAAMHLAEGDLSGALKVYKWPFFPALMATLHGITGIAYETCAQIINAVFMAVAVVAFMATVRVLGGSPVAVRIAAVVFLLHPALNDFRTFIIRDQGYLAFYILGMYFCFKALNGEVRIGPLAWAVIMFVVAALFRVEGFAFLLLLPVLLWWRGRQGYWRIAGVVIYLGLGTIATLALLGWWLFQPTGNMAYDAIISDPGMLLSLSWQNIFASFSAKVAMIEQTILTEFSQGYSVVLVLVTVAMIIVTTILKQLTPLYLGVFIVAVAGRMLPGGAWFRSPWLWLVTTNLLVLTAFTSVKLFLTERYPLALVVTLLLVAPFVLERLYRAWREGRFRRVAPLVGVLVLVAGIDGLSNTTEKDHIKNAGHWLQINTGNDSIICTNSRLLGYYAGLLEREGEVTRDERWFLGDMTRRQPTCDYFGIRVEPGDRMLEMQLVRYFGGSGAEQTFVNGRGDRVFIYRYSTG